MQDTRFQIPVLESIEALAAGTSVWLTDIWGVMHNGVAPFASAVDACATFRAGGGTVLLLSNAPRPGEAVAKQLDKIGVRREAWDLIVSSGDLARELIRTRGWTSVFHIGPERDLGIYEGLGIALTGVEAADGAVCTGLVDDERETPDDYAAVLDACRVRGLAMVCANPDLTVERGSRIVYCAGSVAKSYEMLGGDVTYAGKPYLPIYDLAFAAIARMRGVDVPRRDVLAIGDGIRTDIAGAAAAGVRSVFVASGVHIEGGRQLDNCLLAELFPNPGGGRPVAAMRALAW